MEKRTKEKVIITKVLTEISFLTNKLRRLIIIIINKDINLNRQKTQHFSQKSDERRNVLKSKMYNVTV